MQNNHQYLTINDKQIAAAITTTKTREPVHEHPDCIRIAMAWLSAQKLTNRCLRRYVQLKHIIEAWAGRYVSQADVEVAAKLLKMRGEYPFYNFDQRLVKPNSERLSGIGEAGKHPRYMGYYNDIYYFDENFKKLPNILPWWQR